MNHIIKHIDEKQSNVFDETKKTKHYDSSLPYTRPTRSRYQRQQRRQRRITKTTVTTTNNIARLSYHPSITRRIWRFVISILLLMLLLFSLSSSSSSLIKRSITLYQHQGSNRLLSYRLLGENKNHDDHRRDDETNITNRPHVIDRAVFYFVTSNGDPNNEDGKHNRKQQRYHPNDKINHNDDDKANSEDNDNEDNDTEDSEDSDSEDNDSEDNDSEDNDSEDNDSEDSDSEDNDSEDSDSEDNDSEDNSNDENDDDNNDDTKNGYNKNEYMNSTITHIEDKAPYVAPLSSIMSSFVSNRTDDMKITLTVSIFSSTTRLATRTITFHIVNHTTLNQVDDTTMKQNDNVDQDDRVYHDHYYDNNDDTDHDVHIDGIISDYYSIDPAATSPLSSSMTTSSATTTSHLSSTSRSHIQLFVTMIMAFSIITIVFVFYSICFHIVWWISTRLSSRASMNQNNNNSHHNHNSTTGSTHIAIDEVSLSSSSLNHPIPHEANKHHNQWFYYMTNLWNKNNDRNHNNIDDSSSCTIVSSTYSTTTTTHDINAKEEHPTNI